MTKKWRDLVVLMTGSLERRSVLITQDWRVLAVVLMIKPSENCCWRLGTRRERLLGGEEPPAVEEEAGGGRRRRVRASVMDDYCSAEGGNWPSTGIMSF